MERTLARERDVLPVARQYVKHVFVEPFQLVAHREAKILELLGDERVGLMALFQDPSSGPDSGCFGACSHVEYMSN